ncbi:MAG TPA: hypothetical protein DCO75_04920, partial [Fibrobacteres bacterium]|nr:hypothetical protein [Fibrobacterota bacterium]
MMILTGSLYAFNHPEIKWRSVASEHFIINFYDRTEPAVYAAWKIAEQEYKSLSEIYDFTEHDKINIALADYDDYSNGYASWTNGAIMIWITDSRFDLRGNNTWLRNVITHELTHIVTLEKQSKLQLLDWALSLGYQSPHSDIDLAVPVATSMFWPEWFAEGIAQRESERAGNDSRDARREMLLRDATLFSKPLSLAEMGHFNHNSIGNELVYNQGFSFIKFIENKIGTKRLEEIFNDGRQTTFFPKNFTDYFFEHAGFTLESVYNEWLDTVRADGKKLVPANPTRMNVVWDKGFLNSQPKISSDGKLVGWLSNDKDDYDRTDLLIAPRNNTKKTRRIQWAKQSWDFSPDGQKVYYIKSHTPNESGSYINDIFVMDLKSGVEKHLVKNARAYDLAVSPDNMSLVWIQYREGAFSLVRSAIDGRDRATVVEGKIGEPLWYLSFNPNDPNQIAATHIVDGKTRLVIIGIEDKSMIEVTGAYANEESPFWAKDNRIYYCADYDGVFNIYSIDPYEKDCIRHTSTETGLFSPFVTDSGSLLCSEYRNKGFRIVSCNMSGELYEIPDSSGAVFKPLPTPRGKVSIRSYQYQPKLLRSVWELQTGLSVTDRYGKLENMQNSSAFRNFTDSLSYLITATIYKSQSDALEKRSRWMALEAVVDIEGDTAVKHEHSAEYRCAFNPFVNKKQFSFLNKSASGAHLISNEDLVSSIHAYESLSGNPLHTHTESGDSSSSRSVITELIPGIGWTTLEHTVSMGLNLQGILANSIVPAIIYTDGFAQWQLMRDLYLEFDPVFQFYTYTLFSGNFLSSSVFPLTLAWSTS